ncbi:hypothetical protein BJ138DRAFT_1101280 [Hygrophoropsis aurantiaca]|uniref:Uncharacterized protein n=1 Tax=Hygrophoropsis aurantiaca TaxID=72124 RepID=A0ACB8ADJ4_9AGAM|nr:hypothetical protein BJ138DRAFT_1101280 [Hygrophoropsis aurantiaca]
MSGQVPLPILSPPIAVSSIIPRIAVPQNFSTLSSREEIWFQRLTLLTHVIYSAALRVQMSLPLPDLGYTHLQIPSFDQWTVTKDGNTLVVASWSDTYTMNFYDLLTSHCIRTLELPGNNTRYHDGKDRFLISPEAHKLARSRDGELLVFDLHTGAMLRSPIDHDPAEELFTEIIAWSPNVGRFELLTRATNGSAIIWRVTVNSVEPITDPFQLNYIDVTCAPFGIMFTGDRIIYESKERDIIIGHFENRQFRIGLLLGPRVFYHRFLSLSPDGQLFAASDPSKILIRDTATRYLCSARAWTANRWGLLK